MKDNLQHLNLFKITKIADKKPDPKNPAKKMPQAAFNCDICSSLKKEGNRFKQADQNDYDLCEECFISHEIKTSTEEDGE